MSRRAPPRQTTLPLFAPRTAAPARVTAIVPTERHVARLVREGAAAETRAGLRDRLLAELVPTLVVAEPDEARLALAKALRPIAEAERRLAPLLRVDGAPWVRTVAAVDDALGALRASGASPDALRRVDNARGPEAWKAKTLRLAMQAVDAELARIGKVDARDAGRRLAKALAERDAADVARAAGALVLRARWILVWDASDVAWWRALDAALGKLGGSASIALPAIQRPLDAERERDAFEILSDDVARLLEEPPEIEVVSGTLVAAKLGAPPSDAALALAEVHLAAESRAQARAVVAVGQRALAEGLPLDGVAIVPCAVSSDVVAPIERALNEAGVPLDSSRAADVSSGRIAAFAIDLLRAAAERDVRALLALLKSKYVRLRTRAERERRPPVAVMIELLEKRRCNLDEGLAAPVAHLAPDDDDLHAVARAIDEAFLPLADRASRPALVRRARQLFELLGVGPSLGAAARAALAEDRPASGIARAALHAASRDALAWKALDGALSRIEELSAILRADEAISPSAFVHELTWLAERCAESPRGGRVGAMRIARAGELAAEPLDLAIVVEANEDTPPWTSPRGALLSEELLAEIAEVAGTAAPPNASVRRARELGALLLALSNAGKVVLVARERDSDGAPRLRAPMVEWLLRGGVRVMTWTSAPQAGPALDDRDEEIVELLRGARGSEDSEPARRAHVESVREGFFFDPRRTRSELVGTLAEDAACRAVLAAETGGAERPLAVTQLEKIATCPFRGFAEQVLGARAKQPIAAVPDAREEGTVVHDALAAAFERTRELWGARPRDRDAILRLGCEAAAAVLQRDGAPAGLRLLSTERALAAVAAVLSWSADDDAWDFDGAERAFGDDSPGAWGALRVGESLALRGKIDRVDVRHGSPGVRVLDYKRRAQKAAGLGEVSFQLPVYALVARRERSGSAEADYLPFSPGHLAEHRPGGSVASKLMELLAGDPTVVEARIAELVAQMRRGALAPFPWNERACSHCDADGACRKPRFAIEPDEDAFEGA